MKIKKLKNLGLAILIALTGTSSAFAFDDVFIDDPYYSAITHYEQLGWINGYPDGTFRGEQNINRVEVLKMMLEIKQTDLNLASFKSLEFVDLIPSSWYMPYLEYAYTKDIIRGYPDKTFRPDNPITLAESLSLLYEIYEIPIQPSSPDTWFEPYLEKAEEQGLLDLIEQNEPHHYISRGDVLAMIYVMDTGMTPKPFLELTQPYTLQTLDEIDYQMGLSDPSSSYAFSELKSHVEAILYNDYELPVATHLQEKALSCEIASLKTVMDYLGKVESESILFNKLFKATPYIYDEEKNVWGDPHLGFVGNVNGSQIHKTGYGVYWEPIAKLAQKYFPSSHAFEGEDLNFLLHEVIQGRPVIIWGYTPAIGGKVDLSWKTPEGEKIFAVNGEHTFTVIGFKGHIKAPTGIVMIDPLVGKVIQPTSQFLSNWSTFNNSGVVVKE